MNKEKINYFANLLSESISSKKCRYLGDGCEGILFRENNYIYKVFYNNKDISYYNLFKQICGRFKDSKRFINIDDVFKIEGYTVIKYKYADSKPYTGGRKKDIIEFLIECWKYRVVYWDIKPNNFRVFDDGLKLIDYGWDIKAFNFKDFLFMVQRAYLMIKYGNSKNFRKKARNALTHWEMDDIDELIDFFNKIYKEILKLKKTNRVDKKRPPISTFDSQKLMSRILESFSSEGISHKDVIVYSSDETFKCNTCQSIFTIENLPYDTKYKGIVLDLKDFRLNSISQYIKTFRKFLHQNGYLITIIKNPFFTDESVKNPLNLLKKSFMKTGFKVIDIFDSVWEIDEKGQYFSRYLIIKAAIHENYGHDVSLVIKTCYQDAHMIDRLVRHIVNQLEGPDYFIEKFVVIDPKDNDFLRQFSNPNKALMYDALENLVRDNVIDYYITAPLDSDIIKSFYKRWFNVECTETHTVEGIPVFPQLYAFEHAKGRYIFQVDSDAIIVRRDDNHSFLKDMKNALKNNKKALSVSFNIAHDPESPFKEYSSPGNGLYVPEVRICLIHKERFFSQRPYPNKIKNGYLKLSWYRSVEQAQKEKNLVSLRGGDPRTFYIHPPNFRKKNINEWLFILDRAELGYVPEIQYENVELVGDIKNWKGPKRNETFIFVICGRNVPPRKFLRCWQSVVNQTITNWGAIVIDDASDNNLPELMKYLIREYKDKVTFVRNHKRSGVLHNVYMSIKAFCENPYSVIIILDADDMLLSNHVLCNLRRYYAQGTDMTVGTMFRLDKGIIPYIPDFKKPRNMRGGDVWMHLRSFRKYLFDNVKIEDMQINGKWIDKFTEFTYMIPIAEMASNPKHIRWPIYLYEPTQKRDEEHYKKNKITIEFVLSKKIYPKPLLPEFPVKPPGIILNCINPHSSNIIFLRHSEKMIHMSDPPLTEEGIELCNIFGRKIPIKLDMIIATETKRTIETGKYISMANRETDCSIILLQEYINIKQKCKKERIYYKSKYGWNTYLERWLKGETNEKGLIPSENVARSLLGEVRILMEKHNANNVLVVLNDNTIAGLVKYISDKIITKIDYLNGFVLTKKELDNLTADLFENSSLFITDR